MSRITTVKDKIPKKSILARIFGLRQGFKDKSCPGQEIRETRTRFHPCKYSVNLTVNIYGEIHAALDYRKYRRKYLR